jgi:hypothetical protein
MDLVIGIDIGQRVDPTAIAVAEVGAETPPAFTVRFLERLALGTPYPEVAARVVAVVRGAVARAREPRERRAPGSSSVTIERPSVALTLVTDITGVGRPVHEIIERAITAADLPRAGLGVRLEPVTFTHGDRLDRADGGGRSVGKAYLVSRLQALLQTDRVKLPRTPEAAALARELRDYEIRLSEDANDRYGAFKVGAHDDLVTALGLAVLLDRQSQPSQAFDGNTGRRIA